MRVELDGSACEGTGFCAMVAPALFELADDPPVVVLVEDVPDDELERAREAEQLCPTRAILLEP